MPCLLPLLSSGAASRKQKRETIEIIVRGCVRSKRNLALDRAQGLLSEGSPVVPLLALTTFTILCLQATCYLRRYFSYLVFTDGVPWYRGMGIKSADKNIKGERGVGRISRHHASPQNQSINPLVCEQSIANLIYEGTLRDVWICRTPVLPSVGQSSFRAFRLASISPCESRCGHAL